MNVTEAIRARRSIRKYRDGDIPQEHLDLILEAAMTAPSARNTRPYEFAVVKSGDMRAKIAAISPNFGMIKQASVAIVVCGRPDLAVGTAHEFWVQDCSASTENILLQAKELGYGTCWCGTYPVQERAEAVKELLALQAPAVPFAVIALGVPDEDPPARGFYDKSRVKYY